MDILKVDSLKVGFGKNEILKDISFNMKKGSITALLAPNGTGKTTLFRAILGEIKKQNGSILVDDKNLDSLSLKQRARLISYVSQDFSTPFEINVLDCVLMGANANLKAYENPLKLASKAMKILEDMNLCSLKNSYMQNLSGGQKQLVLLARAILQGGELLLLDEPSAHLDLANQMLLFKEVLKLKSKNKSILINIHDPNLVFQFCNEVIMLKNGVIYKAGGIDILNEENLSNLYGIKIQILKDKARSCILADIKE